MRLPLEEAITSFAVGVADKVPELVCTVVTVPCFVFFIAIEDDQRSPAVPLGESINARIDPAQACYDNAVCLK